MDDFQLHTKKKSNPLFIGIITALVVVTGALAYYFIDLPNQKNQEAPPGITISYPKYQGQIKGDVVCNLPIQMYAFTDAQVSGYTKPAPDSDGNWYDLKQGIHFYHSDSDITVQKVVDNIVPVNGNKILILHYPAKDENEQKQFAAFPELSGQLKITANDIIPANEGIIIFSCKDTKIYKVKDETTPGTDLPKSLATKTKGWILMSAVDKKTLKEALKDQLTKVASVWPAQDAGFEGTTFTQKYEDPDKATLKDQYKMVWVKIGAPVMNTKPTLTIGATSGQSVSVTPDYILHLNELSLKATKEANLKSITFSGQGLGNLSYLDDLKLFYGFKPTADGQKLENPIFATGCKAQSTSSTITMNCDKGAIGIAADSTVYLDLQGHVPNSESIVGANYQIGIKQLDDIKLYEDNFQLVSATSANLPIYWNNYSVVSGKAQTKLSAPLDFAVDTAQSNSTTIILTWKPPKDVLAKDIDHYHFQAGTGSEVGKNIFKDNKTLAGSSVVTGALNLTPGTTYWFSIAAADKNGVEGTAATLTSTTSVVATSINSSKTKIEELTISGKTVERATIYYTVSGNAVPTDRILWSWGDESTSDSILISSIQTGQEISITHDYPPQVKNYDVQAILLNSSGQPKTKVSTTVNVVNVTTPVTVTPKIPAPSNLKAEEIGAYTLKLSWNLPTGENANLVANYHIEYGKTSSTSSDPAVPDTNLTTQLITNLDPETKYYFQVRAVDAKGNKSDPATIEATTVAYSGPLPTNLILSPQLTGSNQVTFKYEIQNFKEEMTYMLILYPDWGSGTAKETKSGIGKNDKTGEIIYQYSSPGTYTYKAELWNSNNVNVGSAFDTIVVK